MLNNDAFDFEFVRMNDVLVALAAAMGGLLGGVILLFVAGANLQGTRLYKRVALTDTQASSKGYISNPWDEALKGKTGIAQTVLRPSGKVIIGGKMYDAYTRGDYIEKGETIEVISDEGSSLKVKLKGS
jgi:membrane-bound serine protease (ClpP class)